MVWPIASTTARKWLRRTSLTTASFGPGMLLLPLREQIAIAVDACRPARGDQDRGIGLAHDGRSPDPVTGPELVAVVDRRRHLLAVVADRALPGGRGRRAGQRRRFRRRPGHRAQRPAPDVDHFDRRARVAEVVPVSMNRVKGPHRGAEVTGE